MFSKLLIAFAIASVVSAAPSTEANSLLARTNSCIPCIADLSMKLPTGNPGLPVPQACLPLGLECIADSSTSDSSSVVGVASVNWVLGVSQLAAMFCYLRC